MKACARTLCCLGLILPIVAGCATKVVAAKAPVLRYRAEPATNVYSVVIEMRSETGKETLAGNILVTTRPAGSNVISLSFQGNLAPKREPLAMPYYGGRPSRWMQPINLGAGSELLMDDQGHILRFSGDYPLPVPLGSVEQLFVPQLPTRSETKWEFAEELPVQDEPLGLGPTKGFGWMQSGYGGMGYPYGMGVNRNTSAIMLVLQRTKAEVKGTAATAVVIQQRIALDSPLVIEAEPRLSATGEGTVTFDGAGGFLRALESDYQALFNSENSTRRTTAKVKIQLLEGAERAAALAPYLTPPDVDPATGQKISNKLAGAELQKAFADLQSDDDAKSRAAANRLTSMELVDPPRALLDYLTGFLYNPESARRIVAVRVIADYGTTEQVPDLIRLLQKGDASVSQSAVRGLGRLKDPRAIEPLVESIAEGGSEAYAAAAALENFDAAAESAVLSLLTEKHVGTKRTACNILRKLGTLKSIEPLKQLITHPDASLSSAAGEAVRAIQARN